MSFSDTVNVPANRSPPSWSNLSVNSLKSKSINTDNLEIVNLKADNIDARNVVVLAQNITCFDIEFAQPVLRQAY